MINLRAIVLTSYLLLLCGILPATAQQGMQNVPPGLPLATSNMTFAVSKTGSNSNPCTTGSPCLTWQHAVAVVSGYNWNNLYFPTINGGNGTYNEQILLPALLNCPNGGVINGNTGSPSSIVIADIGTSYAISLAPNSAWTVQGIKTSGTYGGYNVGGSAALTLLSIDIGGALTHEALMIPLTGAIGATGTTINVSATTASYFIFIRGAAILDTSTITFANAITLSAALVSLDSTVAFLGFAGTHMVNGSNVTITGGQPPLGVNNGGFFEAGTNTLVDGVTLNRNNFPGTTKGQSVDNWSIFQSDLLYTTASPATGATVTVGGGVKRLIVTSAALAALTVVMPPSPYDADRFTVSSLSVITALTLSTSDGSTMAALPTTIQAGQSYEFIFDAAIGFWEPIGSAGTNSYVTADANGVVTVSSASGQDLNFVAGDGNVSVTTARAPAGADANFNFDATATGGKEFSFTSSGSASSFGPGAFSVFDDNDNYGISTYYNSGGGVNATVFNNTEVLCWDASSQFAVPGSCDTGVARNGTNTLEVNNGTKGTLAALKASSLQSNTRISIGTVPTGTTGSCSASGFVGGATAGKFTAPLCAAGTIILSGLPTAPNGYTCNAQDQTTPADFLRQTANSVSSVTFGATTALNDVIVFQCTGW